MSEIGRIGVINISTCCQATTRFSMACSICSSLIRTHKGQRFTPHGIQHAAPHAGQPNIVTTPQYIHGCSYVFIVFYAYQNEHSENRRYTLSLPSHNYHTVPLRGPMTYKWNFNQRALRSQRSLRSCRSLQLHRYFTSLTKHSIDTRISP
jgi:hypothetical protein